MTNDSIFEEKLHRESPITEQQPGQRSFPEILVRSKNFVVLIKGGLIILSLTVSTFVLGSFILSLVPFKYLLKTTRFSSMLKETLFAVARWWIYLNNGVYTWLHHIDWQLEGHESLDPQGSYLLISNHLSSADILAIFVLARGRLPFPRFFLKQELLFVPIFGQALWSYEMPVMKRYTTEYLNRHPEKRGQDLETTTRSCKSLQGQPFTIINFVEGTRFTKAKKERFSSPFSNLLKPRAGGVHMVLDNLGDQLTGVLDLTIVYPGYASPTFGDIIFGRARLVIMRVRYFALDGIVAPQTKELKNRDGIKKTRKWINQLWSEKDRRISKIRKDFEK